MSESHVAGAWSEVAGGLPQGAPAEFGDTHAQPSERGASQGAVMPWAAGRAVLPLVHDVPSIVDGEHLEAAVGVPPDARVAPEIVDLTRLPALPAGVRRGLVGVVQPTAVLA